MASLAAHPEQAGTKAGTPGPDGESGAGAACDEVVRAAARRKRAERHTAGAPPSPRGGPCRPLHNGAAATAELERRMRWGEDG